MTVYVHDCFHFSSHSMTLECSPSPPSPQERDGCGAWKGNVHLDCLTWGPWKQRGGEGKGRPWKVPMSLALHKPQLSVSGGLSLVLKARRKWLAVPLRIVCSCRPPRISVHRCVQAGSSCGSPLTPRWAWVPLLQLSPSYKSIGLFCLLSASFFVWWVKLSRVYFKCPYSTLIYDPHFGWV